MPRRRYFGSIDSLGKDSDGVKIWRLRWQEDGKRRTRCVHGPYSDAERALASIHATIRRRKADGPTISELYQSEYVPNELSTMAASTRRNVVSAWDNHISPRWGNVSCSTVTARDVDVWLQTLSPGTARICLTVLRWCMRRAAMMGHIDTSPLDMKFTLPSSPQKLTRRVITPETIEAYHDAVKGSVIEPAWILAVAGGLRPGESLGVMVGEVEYRAVDGVPFAAVFVQRESSESGGVVLDPSTGEPRLKTRTSRRWAIVREPWASRLIELQKQASADGLTYLCDDGFGRPIGVAQLKNTLRKLYASHGLEWLPPRNLRASFATMAHHDGGLSTEDVARLMGHSKPVITWTVYERPNLDQIAASVVKG